MENLWIEGYCKFICDNEDKIDWKWMSKNPNITWEIIQNNPDKNWSWDFISLNPNITWEIIVANPDKHWNWMNISCHPNITLLKAIFCALKATFWIYKLLLGPN